jgi:hypothetical protein
MSEDDAVGLAAEIVYLAWDAHHELGGRPRKFVRP